MRAGTGDGEFFFDARGGAERLRHDLSLAQLNAQRLVELLVHLRWGPHWHLGDRENLGAFEGAVEGELAYSHGPMQRRGARGTGFISPDDHDVGPGPGVGEEARVDQAGLAASAETM